MSTNSTITLRTTPLIEVHRRAGARLIDFAGWEMPVQYSGITAEHMAVRQSAGLFDVSHMGRISVLGPGARDCLQSLLPYDMDKLQVGMMAYTVLCNEVGGVIDDLAMLCLSEEEYLLVINASRRKVDVESVAAHLGNNFDVALEDRTESGEGMLALQGPKAEAILSSCLGEIGELGYFRCRPVKSGDRSWLVSRAGYTGEDGFEIIGPASDLPELWEQLVAAGAAVAPDGAGNVGAMRASRGDGIVPIHEGFA